MKGIFFDPRARLVIRGFSREAKKELGSALLKLQLGANLGLPISRPMPSVMQGVHEIRLRDKAGAYRVFYHLKVTDKILVFHAFTKKTQETPKSEIDLAKKRLKEILTDA